jgi:nitroimidazol reductase NimA-like FMN-containing flavoprotein (pyridoxamine 5'-phosphate oxidase superfamily)
MDPLVKLPTEDCRRLLRTQVVGRLAFVTPTGPDVVPVNYAFVNGDVHIRTFPDGYVLRHVAGRDVAFEVDSVDEQRWSGWSVVVAGHARVVAEPEHPSLPRARSWTGERDRVLLVIRPRALTGRRLGHRTATNVLARYP